MPGILKSREDWPGQSFWPNILTLATTLFPLPLADLQLRCLYCARSDFIWSSDWVQAWFWVVVSFTQYPRLLQNDSNFQWNTPFIKTSFNNKFNWTSLVPRLSTPRHLSHRCRLPAPQCRMRQEQRLKGQKIQSGPTGTCSAYWMLWEAVSISSKMISQKSKEKKRILGEATHLALSALFTSSFSNGAAGCMFTTVPWCGWLRPLHLFSREPLTVCRKESLVSENRSNKPKCKEQKSWLSMLAQRNIYNELWDKHAHCNLNHHESMTHCNLNAPDGEVVWSPPPHLRPCQHPAKLVSFRYCRYWQMLCFFKIKVYERKDWCQIVYA